MTFCSIYTAGSINYKTGGKKSFFRPNRVFCNFALGPIDRLQRLLLTSNKLLWRLKHPRMALQAGFIDYSSVPKTHYLVVLSCSLIVLTAHSNWWSSWHHATNRHVFDVSWCFWHKYKRWAQSMTFCSIYTAGSSNFKTGRKKRFFRPNRVFCNFALWPIDRLRRLLLTSNKLLWRSEHQRMALQAGFIDYSCVPKTHYLVVLSCSLIVLTKHSNWWPSWHQATNGHVFDVSWCFWHK